MLLRSNQYDYFFKPTFLYIKQHNITGLKYFGKTTLLDPVKYKGSGKHWTRHLNKYGNDVTTLWYQLFTDQDLLVKYALEFSHNNKIVESKEWANLKIENGLWGGGVKGIKLRPQSSEHKQKIRDSVLKNIANKPKKPKHPKIKKTKEERIRGWKWTTAQRLNLKNRHVIRVSCLCCKKIMDLGNFSKHAR